ncbi:hypothetical protein GJ744_001212 [Endocarpon pusillum]|uniref:Uncharacterized protein n=1 Tax=Endocarpon pusillum TaxID=364733 RepID=A0A8H7ADL0_9EURO|nr:hypothetical protein GJ744_001212 [Endocarpon pusillum]
MQEVVQKSNLLARDLHPLQGPVLGFVLLLQQSAVLSYSLMLSISVVDLEAGQPL